MTSSSRSVSGHISSSTSSFPRREADKAWELDIQRFAEIEGRLVADIGCGEGVYTRAFSRMGAKRTDGFDINVSILEDAQRDSHGMENVHFHVADATNLADVASESYDLVFLRAVLHHVQSMKWTITEAARILKRGGTFIIQDRTPDDVLQPASRENLRGYFFESVPRLVKVECENRFTELDLMSAMLSAGLTDVQEQKLMEIRNTYRHVSELEDNLRRRKDRSILVHLSNEELEELIHNVCAKVGAVSDEDIREIDRWTIWAGKKP